MTADACHHQSDSAVQRATEMEILRQLSEQLGTHLSPGKFRLPNGCEVHVDGVTPEGDLFAEVYARIGPLKGAQSKKVATDVLKLSLIKASLERTGDSPRLLLVFASRQAADCVRGWLRYAVDLHGIEINVVEPSPETAAAILAAQAEQVMINPPVGKR